MKIFMGTVLFGLAFCTAAWAGSAQELLKKVDDAEYAAKDSVVVVTMELEESNGKLSKRKMEMYQLGNDKRLIKFLEPADVKGMAFLDADDKMYIYLPAMHKIRRIAGSVKNDNFAGTDFSYDDLSSDRFSDRMEAKAMKEEGDHFVLDLFPRPDSDSQYAMTRMWVRKKDSLFDRIEFFDKDKKKWKVLTRKDFRPAGKYTQSFLMVMEDLKKKHKTRNLVESVKCDTGLSKRFFSKRQLKRH